MNHDILDAEFEEENPTKKQSFLAWVSLLVLWAGVVIYVLYGAVIHLGFIFSLILLIVASVLTYFFPRTGAITTFIVIGLSVVDITAYYPVSYFFSMGAFPLEINLLMLALLVFHFKASRMSLPKFVNWTRLPNVSAEEKEAAYRTKVNRFKRRYTDKPLEELQEIAQHDSRVPEARQAAKELLEEKF